jgi:ADP-ribosylglycohydrolase
MLLELAVGDAYGAGFEYANVYLIRQFNDLSHYVHHPRHKAIRPGMYTDDTQMSIAIAEAILSGERWTPRMLAYKFVECFKRDQRTGYASGFYGFLLDIQDGTDFLKRIRPTSDKSGAAMRAGPVGIFPTPEEVIERCRIQAAITHNTPDGINAACAAALMTHYFLYRHGPKAGLADFIHRYVPGDWLIPWEGKVKSKGWMSVRAAITAVMRNDSMSALLQDCIAFTGDVDTVATIALAAASGSDEVKQDLPQHLIDMLENGPYGRDYLIELDRELLQMIH